MNKEYRIRFRKASEETPYAIQNKPWYDIPFGRVHGWRGWIGVDAKWWHVRVDFRRKLTMKEVRRLQRKLPELHIIGIDGIPQQLWDEKYPTKQHDGLRLIRAVREIGDADLFVMPMGGFGDYKRVLDWKGCATYRITCGCGKDCKFGSVDACEPEMKYPTNCLWGDREYEYMRDHYPDDEACPRYFNRTLARSGRVR